MIAAVFRFLSLLALSGLVCSLSSCFLIGVPVKATGEIIEKSAHASGRAMKRGFKRATTPDGEESPDAYGLSDPQPSSSYSYPEGNSGYYDQYGDPIE